jgi:hypothetical protein
VVEPQRAKRIRPNNLPIAFDAILERIERKHHDSCPIISGRTLSAPDCMSKLETCKLCRPCVDLSNFLRAAAGRVGKDLQGKHHKLNRLFDVLGGGPDI